MKKSDYTVYLKVLLSHSSSEKKLTPDFITIIISRQALVAYYSAMRSLYDDVISNVPVSCKAIENRNQLGEWLDSDQIIE